MRESKGNSIRKYSLQILANLIWKKLKYIEKITGDIQNGFWDGNSVIDNKLVLKIINEKICEYNLILQYIFIIFKRRVTVYIETHYGNVWKNLKCLKNLIKACVQKTNCAVRTEGTMSCFFLN